MAADRLFRTLAALPDEALWAAAQAAWGAGRYDAALALFRRAALASPDPGPRIGLAQALVSLGEVDAGIAVLDPLLPPHSPRDHSLARFLRAVWRLDREPVAASMPDFAAIALGPQPFAEALVAYAMGAALLDRRQAVAMEMPTPATQAHWDSLLLRLPQIPPARLVATTAAVRAIARDACTIDGLVLEFGVYHGLSIRQWQPGCDGLVHGFDSFAGLPEAWSDREGAGALSTQGRLPEVPDHVRLWPGWFRDTLPGFLSRHPGPVRLLHVDCDLYASTHEVLEALADRLVPGSVLVFDDYDAYPGFEAHEYRAFGEFLAAGRHADPLAFAFLGREAVFRMRDR